MAENGNKEQWNESIEKAKQMFNDGWKELAKAAELAKEKGDDAWEMAQEKGRDAWVNAKAKGMERWVEVRKAGNEAWEDIEDKGEQAVKDAERLVRKYPTRAVGLSVLLGVLLGALISKDRD